MQQEHREYIYQELLQAHGNDESKLHNCDPGAQKLCSQNQLLL
jgi:hypothetical protein